MKLIKLLALIIVLLVITNVTLTNRSLDDGLTLSNLSKEIAELQNQNIILRARIASAGSLTGVKEKLLSAGYTESPRIVAVPENSSVASR